MGRGKLLYIDGEIADVMLIPSPPLPMREIEDKIGKTIDYSQNLKLKAQTGSEAAVMSIFLRPYLSLQTPDSKAPQQ